AEENNVTVESIKKENKLTSDVIVPGQIIEIDGEKEDKEEVKKDKEDKKEEVYIIKAGDTLFEIEVEFDVTVAELKEWNNLSSDIIFEGKELIVSGDAAKAAAPVEEAPAAEETEAVPAQEETYEEPAEKERKTSTNSLKKRLKKSLERSRPQQVQRLKMAAQTATP